MRAILTISLLFFLIHSDAQTNNITNDYVIFDTFETRIARKVADHACVEADNHKAKVVSYTTYDTLFRPIFSKVIVGANELVNQGSAYTLSVDQYKALFAINYNWEIDKVNPKKGFYNVGFNASSSSSTFQLFSKNEWQRGIGLVFGLTKPITSSLRFDSADCANLAQKRVTASVYWLNAIRTGLAVNTTAIQGELDQADQFYQPNNSGTSAYGRLQMLQLQKQKAYDDAKQQLSDALYLRAISANLTDGKIDKYIDSLNTKFERENFKDFNYSLLWYNINFRPEYKAISIYDTSAAKTVGIQKKDFFRLGVNFNLNYARNGTNLFFIQAGIGIVNTNYLEGKKSDQIQFLITPVNTDSIIVDNKEATVVKNYDMYKKQFPMLTPNVGINWFWGEKRLLGYELFASTKLGLKPRDVPFDNLFTVRTGLLVSLNGKTDLAKSTFGLIAQWEDLKMKNPTIKDNFTFNIRIGIPFNF